MRVNTIHSLLPMAARLAFIKVGAWDGKRLCGPGQCPKKTRLRLRVKARAGVEISDTGGGRRKTTCPCLPCQTPFETLLGAPPVGTSFLHSFIHSLLAPINAMPKKRRKERIGFMPWKIIKSHCESWGGSVTCECPRLS